MIVPLVPVVPDDMFEIGYLVILHCLLLCNEVCKNVSARLGKWKGRIIDKSHKNDVMATRIEAV